MYVYFILNFTLTFIQSLSYHPENVCSLYQINLSIKIRFVSSVLSCISETTFILAGRIFVDP